MVKAQMKPFGLARRRIYLLCLSICIIILAISDGNGEEIDDDEGDDDDEYDGFGKERRESSLDRAILLVKKSWGPAGTDVLVVKHPIWLAHTLYNVGKRDAMNVVLTDTLGDEMDVKPSDENGVQMIHMQDNQLIYQIADIPSNTSVSRNFTLIPKKAASWNYVGHRAKVAYTFQNTDSEMIHQEMHSSSMSTSSSLPIILQLREIANALQSDAHSYSLDRVREWMNFIVFSSGMILLPMTVWLSLRSSYASIINEAKKRTS